MLVLVKVWALGRRPSSEVSISRKKFRSVAGHTACGHARSHCDWRLHSLRAERYKYSINPKGLYTLFSWKAWFYFSKVDYSRNYLYFQIQTLFSVFFWSLVRSWFALFEKLSLGSFLYNGVVLIHKDLIPYLTSCVLQRRSLLNEVKVVETVRRIWRN